MSDIKRFRVDTRLTEDGLVPYLKADNGGVLVLYDDHLAALEAVKGTSPQDHEARIKALERMMTEKTLILDHAFEVSKELRKRIEGLEKALNEHMVKERECKVDQRDYISRLGVIQDAGYSVIIDPKASPKGIPFEVALAYLKAGREIRRPHWNTPSRRRVQPQGISGRGGLYVITGASYNEGEFKPDTNEMMATDWEVVIPEKQ